jgi:uncharacterized glyoxalase superfamily protein PhnB
MITPYLYYEDVAAAVKWLSKAFGFRRLEQMKGPQGNVTHASMQFGDAMVMMGDPGPTYRNPKRLRALTQCQYVNVEDADAMFRKAIRAGAKAIEEPKDTGYGARRCGVEDPEGHQWYFAHELATRRVSRRSRRG